MLLDALKLFKTYYAGIAWIVLPLFIPMEIFDAVYYYYFVGADSGILIQMPPILVRVIGYPIYTGAVIFYLSSILSGDVIDTKKAWSLGVQYWGPFFVLNILVWIAITAGFFLFIAPGIILIGRLAFSEFDLLLEKREPLYAMKNSWQKTGDYMWMILWGYLIISLVLYGPYFAFILLMNIKLAQLGVFYHLVTILYAFLSVIYTVFTFRVYHLSRETAES